MQKNPDYIVVHDFNKVGSACMKFEPDDKKRFKRILATCLNLAKPPIQVVRLGGPDVLNVYCEYSPYTFVTEEQELINMCLYGNVPGECIHVRTIKESNNEK